MEKWQERALGHQFTRRRDRVHQLAQMIRQRARQIENALAAGQEEGVLSFRLSQMAGELDMNLSELDLLRLTGEIFTKGGRFADVHPEQQDADSG